MSLENPVSTLTTEQLRKLGHFDRTTAEALDLAIGEAAASGGGGGGGTPGQVITYTATGGETDIMIDIPLPEDDDLYRVQATLAGVALIVGISCPNNVGSDRTTTQFRFVTTYPLTAGDKIDFLVYRAG